jgi:hypothetical protein
MMVFLVSKSGKIAQDHTPGCAGVFQIGIVSVMGGSGVIFYVTPFGPQK